MTRFCCGVLRTFTQIIANNIHILRYGYNCKREQRLPQPWKIHQMCPCTHTPSLSCVHTHIWFGDNSENMHKHSITTYMTHLIQTAVFTGGNTAKWHGQLTLFNKATWRSSSIIRRSFCSSCCCRRLFSSFSFSNCCRMCKKCNWTNVDN